MGNFCKVHFMVFAQNEPYFPLYFKDIKCLKNYVMNHENMKTLINK